MDDDEFKEDDDDIHKIVQYKDFHSVNKKTYEFKIDYDSSLGYYSTRLSIDLIYLPIGSYTMVYEMYIDDDIPVDEIDAVSGTLTVGKINSKIDGTNTRSIIHFTKYSLSSGFDDLDIDIKLKGKTDPQTTIYVVVYGVKGQVNNVPVNLWDRFYHLENNMLGFEIPINMSNKKITGVADGVDDGDVVIKKQLDSLDVEITNNKNDIATMNTNYGYYYFTDQLQHDNEEAVKFPASENHYPFSTKNAVHENFVIKLSGYYHLIYCDFYKGSGTFKIIHQLFLMDRPPPIYTLGLNKKSDWTPITINAIIKVDIIKLNRAEIVFYFDSDDNGILDGGEYSSFYIKYLHP